MPTTPGSPFSTEQDSAHPKRTGSYRIERVLGTGGTGKVYLAIRDDDHFRKQVALKLMRPELRGAELRGRFRGERQILALLNHPNIAALVDGGETESDRLYEVMEYVAGSPIDAYCRAQGLRGGLARAPPPRRSPRHQARQCLRNRRWRREAARFRHRQDSAARAVRSAGQRNTRCVFPLHTLRKPRAGPEPAGLELLTGTVPCHGTNHTETALARAICDDEPRTPSGAAANQEDRDALAGDLDNIILMALRKEPSDRYASVDQLASDIRRHLEGFPVRARGSSARYRFSMFVRRNRAPVAAAASIAVVLATAGLCYPSDGRTGAARAGYGAGGGSFHGDHLRAERPWAGEGRELAAKELLERGVDRIDIELAGRPEVQGILKHIAGKTLRYMGDLDRGRPLLEQSLELRVELGRLNVMAGRYAEGAKQLEEAASIYRCV